MGTWLYRVRPARFAMLTEGPTPEEQRRVGEHFAYLQALCRDGVVHLAGRTLDHQPDGMGIVLFSATDESAARALMEDDPAVRHGVMDATLFPYRVALLNPDSLAQAQHEE
jgi:uncharacterized protein YciI